tara:strand:+ start:272 stop:628 length:357 start_codon:yes stop_codon:yes gene_type:complete
MDEYNIDAKAEFAAIPERVASGSAFFDQVYPGWHNKIDVNELDVACNCFCIVGQLYGAYTYHAQRLFGGAAEGVPYGVYADPLLMENIEYYEALTLAWIEAIALRHNTVAAERESLDA